MLTKAWQIRLLNAKKGRVECPDSVLAQSKLHRGSMRIESAKSPAFRNARKVKICQICVDTDEVQTSALRSKDMSGNDEA